LLAEIGVAFRTIPDDAQPARVNRTNIAAANLMRISDCILGGSVRRKKQKPCGMRCLLKRINALPGKPELEVYETADYKRSLQHHSDWLSDMDSNQL
jgi:hypothetical protein